MNNHEITSRILDAKYEKLEKAESYEVKDFIRQEIRCLIARGYPFLLNPSPLLHGVQN
jgi:hypothetical protein